jgi:hypothetical protein
VAPDQSGRASQHHYIGPALPVYGAYHYCAWKEGSESRLVVLARSNYGPPEKCYGYEAVEHPGFAIQSHGRGRTAMVPWTIGRSYRELGLTVSRDVMHGLVQELLDGDEIVSADLPESVEITVGKSGDRLVIHVINMSGARRANFGPPIPVSGGRLRIRGATGASVRTLVSGAECEVARSADGIEVALPEIGLFEVVVVQG